jgi:hypothetical protein
MGTAGAAAAFAGNPPSPFLSSGGAAGAGMSSAGLVGSVNNNWTQHRKDAGARQGPGQRQGLFVAKEMRLAQQPPVRLGAHGTGRMREPAPARPSGLRMLYDFDTPAAFPQVQIITQRSAGSFTGTGAGTGAETGAGTRVKQDELADIIEQSLMQTRW